jgi:hypothetical protein
MPSGTTGAITKHSSGTGRRGGVSQAAPMTPEQIDQMIADTQANLNAWKPRGKEGSYAAARNQKQRQYLSRRLNILQSSGSNTGAQGAAPTWVNGMAMFKP